METAALVLGIISLAVSIFGTGYNWIGSVCGLLAIIFGALGLKHDNPNRGRAKAGLILGIVSLALGIILTIACTLCAVGIIGAAAAASNSYGNI